LLAALGAGGRPGATAPGGAGVGRPADPEALARRRPDQRRRAARVQGVQVCEQARLGGGSVFQVDHDPIQPRPGQKLRGSRRVEARPCADERLAAENPLAEGTGHVRMMPAVTHPLWPLLDLRLETGNLVLRLPREEELGAFSEVAGRGIHPPEEMPFGIAWTDVASLQRERDSYQWWMSARAGWSVESWVLTLGVWV